MGCFTSEKFKQNCALGWLPLSHADAITEVEGLELSALCDTVPEAVKKANANHPGALCFEDYREMIRTVQPDIVTIATRTPERAAIVRFAAENGVKGIHIEKPLAQSLGVCLDVIECLDKHAVKISYGTYRRYHGLYRQAMDIVGKGHLGKLRELTIEMGREWLLWCHPHSIDMMLMISGERVPEIVWGDCLFNKNNVNTTVLDEDPIVRHGYVRFSEEFTASIIQQTGRNLRLCGDAGVLTIKDNGKSMHLKIHEDDRTTDFKAFSGPSGTMSALLDIRDGILEGKPTSFGLAELEMNTRLLMCLAYSAVQGYMPVRPELLPTDFTVTGRMGQLYA